MYGITEAANWIGGYSLAAGRPHDGKVGKVWGGSAMVLRDDGSSANSGEGELLVQTPSLMNGYFGRPDLTAEVLKDGWLHTGDTGNIDRAGNITITGRRKSEINRAGMKIQPEEIDLLLERHPGIREACVFGVADEFAGERVAAACVLGEGSGLRPAEIRSWLSNLIRREAIPETWFYLDEIPKTDRGKINRNRVRDHCAGKDAVT